MRVATLRVATLREAGLQPLSLMAMETVGSRAELFKCPPNGTTISEVMEGDIPIIGKLRGHGDL